MDTNKLRQKILDLAIRGKLVPQDPNDEPASILLERIKAEKEQLIKEGKIKRSKKSKTTDKAHYENPPFEIPESWEWVKLGEVCQIFGRIGFRGYTKEDLVYSDGAITLSPSNIVNGKMSYENCTYITWTKYEESPEIKISNNDIILVKTGSSYGKCALVTQLPHEATINPQFVVLKYILYNTRLLSYVLQSGYARYNYDQFVIGTAIPTFTQAVLANMKIPLPPQKEQIKIVETIERWFSVIDNIKEDANALELLIKKTKSKILDLAIQGKLVPQDPNDEPASELLKRINPKAEITSDNGHYEKLPKGWLMCTIGDLFDVVSAKRVLKSNWTNKGIPFYRAREIVQLHNEGVANKDLFINEELFAELKYKFGTPNVGDIMLSAVGSIGYTYIVKEKDSFYYKDASVICLRNVNKLNSQYFSILFETTLVKEQMHNNSKGTTVDTITIEKLKKYSVPLPPLSEQHRIVAKIEELFEQLNQIQESLEA